MKKPDFDYYKMVVSTQNDPDILRSELKDLINESVAYIETEPPLIAVDLQRGVSLLAILADMRHRYIADRGVKPKYLILGPDYADRLSEEIYRATMMSSKHAYMIRGGEKYNDLTILILPGELKFIDVAG